MSSLDALKEAVASAEGPIDVRGGGSKADLSPVPPAGHQVLDVTSHSGIVAYEPTELVLRAKAGTTIAEIEQTLHGAGQMLGFEPPAHDGRATLGGTIAAAANGARRPFAGAARDFVLGVGLVTGEGRYEEFGGQVMKNVAGFDVARLVCGSFGSLGIIADVSLKTLPAPEAEVTLVLELGRREAHGRMLEISCSTMPVSGLAWMDGRLFVRLSGARPAVEAARRLLGGDEVEAPWRELSACDFARDARQLWRISVAPASDTFLDEAAVIDWGGGLRWLADPIENPRSRLKEGHATLVRDQEGSDISRRQPLSPFLMDLHCAIKAVLDPRGIMNPDRLYPGL